jgi:hypothetical protein
MVGMSTKGSSPRHFENAPKWEFPAEGVHEHEERGEKMGKKTGSKTPDEHPQCCGQMQIPSEEEMAALNVMREIKREVRSLKQHMRAIQEDAGNLRDTGELQKRIELLRTEWNRWEEKRKAAAKTRMILLGHEKEDDDQG